MQYHDPQPYGKKEIDDAIKSNDVDKIWLMMIGVTFNEPNYDFAFKVVSQFVNSKFDRLRNVTVLCIGYLSVFHHRVNIYEVAEIINNALVDESKDVRGRVYDALSDIKGACPREYAEMKPLLANVTPQ